MKCAAERLGHFEEGIFARLNRKATALKEAGKEVFDLSVGTPDFAPPDYVMRTVAETAMRPECYRYTLRDYPVMTEALAAYYKKRYGVDIDPKEEVVAVHGTQEGMGHLGLAICNEGDVVMLPNPGYPVFEAGAYFGGADIYYYTLLRENRFLPVLEDIPEEVFLRTRYFVTSYPSNPTGAIAPRAFYEKLIDYAKRYDFMIINDNAYSDIVFNEESGFSFLSLPGAREVGAEFFSLSKSFNLTGARLSFLVGNKDIVSALRLMRSQLDFGIFLPLQYAVKAALEGPTDFVRTQCEEYRRRRDALCDGLRRIGWNVENSEGTMFVFVRIPEGAKSSIDFAETLLEKTGVVCTPGTAFGSLGEGYIRFALTQDADTLRKITERIGAANII